MTNNNSFKTLTFFSLFSLIISSIIGSGIFDLPQNIAHESGEVSVIIGWAIVSIGLLALTWSFVYISIKKPKIQNGIYGYAKYGFGNYIGFNVAWGYALNSILANVSYLIYICTILSEFKIFRFLGTNGNSFDALILKTALIWLVYYLVHKGIKDAVIVNTIISVLKILILIVVLILFIYFFKFSVFKVNFHYDLAQHHIFSGIKNMMLVSVWSFTGIESACMFALNAKSMKDVANSTILGAVVVLFLCISISLLPYGMIKSTQLANLTTPSTATILSMFYTGYYESALKLGIVVCVLGALLAWTMIASNILLLTSQDKVMPKYFLKVNDKNTPSNSLLFCSIVVQIFVIIAYYTNSVYLLMLKLSTSLILLPYLFTALFAYKLVIKKKFDLSTYVKSILAVLFGIWLVYSGGFLYLGFSSIMYLIGFFLYVIARKSYNLPVFSNGYEIFTFIIIVLLTIVSLLNLNYV